MVLVKKAAVSFVLSVIGLLQAGKYFGGKPMHPLDWAWFGLLCLGGIVALCALAGIAYRCGKGRYAELERKIAVKFDELANQKADTYGHDEDSRNRTRWDWLADIKRDVGVDVDAVLRKVKRGDHAPS